MNISFQPGPELIEGLAIHTKHIEAIDQIVLHGFNQQKYTIQIPGIFLAGLKTVDTDTRVIPLCFGRLHTMEVDFNDKRKHIEYDAMMRVMGMTQFIPMLYKYIPSNNNAVVFDAMLSLNEKHPVESMDYHNTCTSGKKSIMFDISELYGTKTIVAFVEQDNTIYDQIQLIEGDEFYKPKRDLIQQRFHMREYFAPHVYVFTIHKKIPRLNVDGDENLDKTIAVHLTELKSPRTLHLFIFYSN
jgi:hypothetical protein